MDRDRLGIFGVSVGGTLTWIVAGVDARVKAAAPIYGCGWESYYEYPPQPDAPVDRAHAVVARIDRPGGPRPAHQVPDLVLERDQRLSRPDGPGVRNARSTAAAT